MPVSGTRKKRIPPFHISRKGAEAQRKAGKPACRAFTLRLCAFAGFWGDIFFLISPAKARRRKEKRGNPPAGHSLCVFAPLRDFGVKCFFRVP
ncbi:MAG: hypothetical protein B6245_20630 [Desulfobacteraceae bacterium 4572_88]|nr:MAG: hypothetical protein B6245_20630 [Desulfobacteraceae bacterium 4572_88]